MRHFEVSVHPLIAAVAIAAAAMLCGCSVKQPSGIETKVANGVKHHLTVRNKGERNPLPATAGNIANGRKIFGYYCVACHGLDGQGTGVPFAESMSPPVPSLASAEVQSYSDGQLKWIIENGIYPSGMPASKGILGDDEVWSMIHYLRNLPAKGSLGDPKFYSGQ
jgi:mono/diheme cytochrome c family protein